MGVRVEGGVWVFESLSGRLHVNEGWQRGAEHATWLIPHEAQVNKQQETPLGPLLEANGFNLRQ